MSNQSMLCPPEIELKALLDGSLPEPKTNALSQHLENCIRCREAIDQLAAGEDWPEQVAKHLSRRGGPENAAAIRAAERWKIPQPESFGRDDLEQLAFLEPSDQPGVLGMLGTYEITETIGRGGFGLVLKGRDPRLNRIVAVKVLAPEWASNATARRRFLREAQAAAAVRHDHVVTIYAVDEVAKLPYLVMEYVPGKSLQERLDETGPLEVREILRIGRQIALGLAAAHAEGLIHRDIKPGNVLLEDGIQRVKITDFGLARAVDDIGMTQTGTVAGTPEYMSPEQAWGGVVDHRTDLFSLGGVLYAMCTGRSPFRAKSAMAVLKRVCEDEPRPIEDVNPEVPLAFVAIIEQLLAKDPTQRFDSAQEVADLLGAQLAAMQNADTVHMSPEPIPEKSMPPWLLYKLEKVPLGTWSWIVDCFRRTNGWRPWRGFPRKQATPVPAESRVVRWWLMLQLGGILLLVVPFGIVIVLEKFERRNYSYAVPEAIQVYPSQAGETYPSMQSTAVPQLGGTQTWSPPLRETNELTLDIPNPKVEISIDGTLYPVEAAGRRHIRLGVGKHEISVADDERGWFDQVSVSIPTSESYLRIDRGGIMQSSAPTNVKVQWIPLDNPVPLRFKGPDDVLLAANYPGYGEQILAWNIKLAQPIRGGYSSSVSESSEMAAFGMGGSSAAGIQTLAITRNGHYLAVARQQDHKVKLFDVEDPSNSNWFRHMTVTQHADGIQALEFSPDGRYLLSAGQSRAELFRLDDLVATKLGEMNIVPQQQLGQRGQQLGQRGSVWKPLFLPDGQHLLISDHQGNLELWKTQPLQKENVFPSREFNWGQIREMAVDATGQRVLLTSPEKLHLFDLKQGKVVSEFPWPDNRNLYLHHAEFLPDNRHVAFAVNGKTGWENTELWIGDTKTGVITARLNFQEALRTQSTGMQFHDFKISPDGRRITSACITHSEVTHPNHAIAVVSWAVPEEAFGEKTESKVQPLRFEQIQTFNMPGELSSLAVTPDGEQFVTGSTQGGPATLREVSHGEIIHRLESSDESAKDGRFDSHIAISPDGQRIAECQGTMLRLWDRDTGKQQFESRLEDMMEHQGQTLNRVHAIRSVAWSPDGKQILIACPKPIIPGDERRRTLSTAFTFLVQIEDGKANVAEWFEHPDDVNQAIFLGDGRLFATACDDGRARIWERDANAPSREMRANDEAILSLDATPDGAYLAAGSADGTWHLWETRFGHRLNYWAGESAVTAIKFLPQGNQLVTSHKVGHLALWNLSEATETARTPENGSPIAMALSADGKQLLTAIASKDANQTGIQVWTVPIAEKDQPKPQENSGH